jgi:PAS domain S-box-containing protein
MNVPAGCCYQPPIITLKRKITMKASADTPLPDFPTLNRFPKLLEQHSAVNLILDAETGRIIDANNAAAQFYGWPIEILKKMNIQEINTLSPEAVKGAMKAGVTLGNTIFEFRHRRADGSIRDVEVFTNKIENAGKDFLYSIIHDITDRNRAAEALRQSETGLKAANEKLRQKNEELLRLWKKSRQTEEDLNRANQDLIRQAAELAAMAKRKQAEKLLRENHEEMQMILNASPIKIFYKDCDNRYIRVNKMMAEVAGLSKEAMEGKTTFDIYPNQAEHCWKDDKEVIASGKPKRGIIEQIDSATGTRWMRTDKIPYRDNDGHIIGIIGFSVDITELKLAEEQLQAINENLERRVEQRTRELQETQAQYLHAEKLSAIGELSASIAHEFNNPLQGVMTILKGLKRRAILDDEDKELLDLAIEENKRMKNLIKSLQDFNHPSAGKRVLMDVHTSINSLLLLYRSDFKRKRISTVLNYGERLPQILAIPDQIKQVILNLLNNATDACLQKGGIITISTWHDEKTIAIAIKDNGVGIPPEERHLIFRPFYTTKPEVKGIGLGLSVCHGIVQNHRGEIRVESQPGEGSTFTVLLPTQRG